jgi:single-stranded-DNA-specific exonuclease
VLWKASPFSTELSRTLGEALGVGDVTASILAQRGFTSPEMARAFLDPRLGNMTDPFAVTNMDAAVKRLRAAMTKGESIAVFGDYDVDGVTATVIVLDLLARFGITPRYILPRRMEEGYGLSRTALERMLEGGRPDLLLALDCGTNSAEEARWLKNLGTDLVILDHHTSRDEDASKAGAVLVNPHLFDEAASPWTDLCTAGLAFKLAHALLKDLRKDGDETAGAIDLRETLDLVAMGTIADLVTLTGENRILARKGLEKLRSTSRTGLAALFEVSGIEPDQPVTPFDISFRLSPRINASGRLADAGTAVEMLRGDDWAACLESARALDRMNRERQEIERTMAAEAVEMVAAEAPETPAIVLYSPSWHPGVAGIVASRLAGHFLRPAIVLCSDESGLLKGSGRGVTGVDLTSALADCAGLLKTWGGHPMAVGVSLRPENLDAFRAALCEAVSRHLSGSAAEPSLDIAGWITPSELSENLFREIEGLGPFGQGNPEPVLGIRGARLSYPASLFGSGHCRFSIETSFGRLGCVAWRTGGRVPPAGVPVDLAARLTWNVWKGRRNPQLQVEDWREVSGEEPIRPEAFAEEERRLR